MNGEEGNMEADGSILSAFADKWNVAYHKEDDWSEVEK